jgi:uncharacterized protein (DUF1501 family)
MNISRRLFLRNGAIALASVGLMPLWGPDFLRQTVFAENPSARRRKILICIFQRGAADGLSMVVPFADKHYYKYRREIALADPARGKGVLDMDGYFGLHPSMAAFLPIYQAGHLGVIHACGSPNATRSHFDAQDFMESGVVDDKSINHGWLNRALTCCPEDRAKLTPFRAVSMTSNLPRILQGDHEALVIPDLKTFGVQSSRGKNSASTGTGFEGMYENAVGDVLHGTGKEVFDAMAMLKQANPTKYEPQYGAKYPSSPFGRSLMQIAQLVKADMGLQVAFAESGGWDTHANQGGMTGQLSGRLLDFSKAVAALYQDLGDRMADVVILTMSEFGRAVRQNGNLGTDHGHATAFFVLGGDVNGGKVLGKWPGLEPEQLFEGRDLALTTDYRVVFSEIAHKHFGIQNLSTVFPDFQVRASDYRQILKKS